MRTKILILGLACFFIFAYCESPADPEIKKVLNPENPNLPTITIEYFNAEPNSVAYGESSMLSWSTKNATTVIIDQGIGSVSTTGTQEINPSETTTYTLTATNNDDQKTKSCKIEVTSPLPVIEFFHADPWTINPGESSTLSWSVTNATLVEIGLSHEPYSVPNVGLSGEYVVWPTETAIYKLIAENEYTIENNCPVEKNCTVIVKLVAYFEIVSGPFCGLTNDGRCKVTGMVKNTGDATGSNVVIEFQAYDASDVIIGTAYGYPVDGGNIAPGVSEPFDATFHYQSPPSWAYVAKLTYEISWLTAQNTRVIQGGIVSF